MERNEIVGSVERLKRKVDELGKLEDEMNVKRKEIEEISNKKNLLLYNIGEYKKYRRWNVMVNIGFIICLIAFIACIVLTFTYDDKQYVIESYQETAVVTAIVFVFKLIVFLKTKGTGIGKNYSLNDANEEMERYQSQIKSKRYAAEKYDEELMNYKRYIKYTGKEWDFLSDIEGHPSNIKLIESDIIRMMIYIAFDPSDDIDKIDSWINKYYDICLAYSLTDDYAAKAKCEKCSEIMKNSGSWILQAFNAFMSTRGIAFGQALMASMGKSADSFSLKDAFDKCELGKARTELDNEFLKVCLVFANRHCNNMVIGNINGYYK